MSVKSAISMTTRTSDLDSLRHVNNRVYEQFCSEARYRLLEEQGYSIESLLEKNIVMRPVVSFVKFFLQQKSGAKLNVQTEAFPQGEGLIFWDHYISQPDGKVACHLQATTESLESLRTPVDLLPVENEVTPQVFMEEIPNFSGNCSRMSNLYSAIYTDMDYFGNLPLAAWWRVFEEGRHMSSEQLGLTLENFIRLDTHFFWVSGTYRCYQPIKAGQIVRIHTWLERIVRIRVYIRQEIRTEDDAQLLGASREEHLIVSLIKARPRTMPPEMMARMQAYVEYPE
jgi:acyl-CoA thioesterase FadM